MENSVENCENEENLNKDEKSRRREKEFKKEVGKLVTMILGDVRYDKARWERRTALVKQVVESLNNPQFVKNWLISILENMNSSHGVRNVESTLHEFQSQNIGLNQDCPNAIHEISPDNIPLNGEEDLQMKVQKTREESRSLGEELKQQMAVLEQTRQSISEARRKTMAFKKFLKETDDSFLEITENDNLNEGCTHPVEGHPGVDTNAEQLRLDNPQIPASSPIKQNGKYVEVHDQEGSPGLSDDVCDFILKALPPSSLLHTSSFWDSTFMSGPTAKSATLDGGTNGTAGNKANVKLSPDETCIHGYKVFKRNANALDEILQKKPSTVKNFRLAHQDLQSPFMNSLAEVYLKVKNGKEEMLELEVEDIESMELMIEDMEHTGLQLTWLKQMLAEVCTKLELKLQEEIKTTKAKTEKAELDLFRLTKKQRSKAKREIIVKRFDECDISEKQALKKKFRELGEPAIKFLILSIEKAKTDGCPPALKMDTSTRCNPSYFDIVDSGCDSTISPIMANSVKLTKKRKKLFVHRPGDNFQYLDSFPVEIYPYIHSVVDVKSDGHCGFRAIAGLLGMSVDAWSQVRQALMDELGNHRDDYVRLYGCQERVDELMQSLMCFKTIASKNHWMILPDMGHLISSRYDVVLVHLSSRQCLTYLPLRSPPPLLKHKLIAIGFVNNCHFVQVFMKPGAPIPPIADNWHRYRYKCAREWELPYVSRIKNFKLLFSSKADVATREIIHLD